MLKSGKTYLWTALYAVLALLVFVASARAGTQRVRFDAGRSYLVVEVLSDGLLHFETSAVLPGPAVDKALWTSPMVLKTDYSGPDTFICGGAGNNVIETAALRLTVDPHDLAISVFDKARNSRLTTIRPTNLNRDWKGLQISRSGTRNVYGLGQQFMVPGTADGDLLGRVRSPGNSYGNAMMEFNGGMNGNTQIPIMYALGDGQDGYALFLDQVYTQRWDFVNDPWQVETYGDQIRFYLIAGPNLPALRTKYMELVGRPPVPPRQAFGLWASAFGLDTWPDLDRNLAGMRRQHFPVDGFMFDLQWFGTTMFRPDSSTMGKLAWDTSHFPSPAEKIASLKNQDGVGLVLIEESYVAKHLPEHELLASRGFLVKESKESGPTFLDANPWWGRGGMIDWTNDAACDFWHDQKRQPLDDMGVVGHWTDLGEPEMFNPQSWYHGVPGGGHLEADAHNLYNFKWAEGIERGYRRHGDRRPWIITRSGAAGIQRFGAGFWSADIASRLSSLATHLNSQMQMSLSGIDYYASDIGGYRRERLDSDLGELYTQWFADAMMFDIPARPHTDNQCKCRPTSPDLIGHSASNLANLRLRYELSPYFYSLAHRAYLFGEPVVPPLVYYYQSDINARVIGNEKLVGRDLLVAGVARAGESSRDVYLPKDDWVDYYTGELCHSSGESRRGVPEWVDGKFHLPLFVRSGAIIPKMYVDDQTMNLQGKRQDGSLRNDLVLRVYPNRNRSSFLLYEDDGETTAYQQGALMTTRISQSDGERSTVTIEPSSGTFTGAPAQRPYLLELVTGRTPARVTIDGKDLEHLDKDLTRTGWWRDSHGMVIARSGERSIRQQSVFEVEYR